MNSATPPPNFFDKRPLVNYPSTIYGVCITLMILLWLTTAVRLWARFRIVKSPGWDDLFVVLAVIHVSMGAIALCVATRYGLGQHIYLLTPQQIRSYLICHWLIGASYVSSTALIKVSLLCQYMRIFERSTFTYLFTQLLAVFIGLWGFTFTFMGWFPCFPNPAAFWNGTSKGCYASFSPDLTVVVKTIEGHSAVNVAFDFLVLAIALKFLFMKDAPVNGKGLMALLCMGVVGCSFGAWRLAEIVETQAGKSSTDLTWAEPMPVLLSIVEVCIACLCASTPFFWPIIREGLDKIFVMYEFKVSVESRYHDDLDDQVELASTTPWSGLKSASDKEDFTSLENVELGKSSNRSIYRNDYSQKNASPFGEEFHSEATVQTGQSRQNSKKKVRGGQFNSAV